MRIFVTILILTWATLALVQGHPMDMGTPKFEKITPEKEFYKLTIEVEREVVDRIIEQKHREPWVDIIRRIHSAVAIHEFYSYEEAKMLKSYTYTWEKRRELRRWSLSHGYLSLPAVLVLDLNDNDLIDFVYVFDYVHYPYFKLLNLTATLTRIPGYTGLNIHEIDMVKILEDAREYLEHQVTV